MPRYYPMMMDLGGRRCVVVGGGDVAARKIETLVRCGARVTVIAPEIDPSLLSLVDGERLTHLKGEYRKGHLDGAVLAIGATDDEKVNRAVFADAGALKIPVNVVDVPELCSFIVPSVIERGDLLIAVSTSGKSPAMSKRIRKEMEKHFGPEYAEMLKLMGEVRALMRERVPELDRRMEALTAIANSDLLDRLRAGERPSARDVLERALSK